MYYSRPTTVQIWRTPHPPKRGSLVLFSQPLIHSGFLLTWQASGLGAQVRKEAAALHYCRGGVPGLPLPAAAVLRAVLHLGLVLRLLLCRHTLRVLPCKV